MSDMSPHHGRGTLAVHAGVEPDPTTGAIMTPVYLTSTYVQDGVGNHKGFEYSRTHNPTRSALEAAFAALEPGSHGLAFASGLAAMDTVLKTLQPGDEVISTNDLYGGSYRLFTTVFAHYGITFHFVDLGDLESLKAKLNEHTRLIWVETPTNPLMQITDISAVANLVKGSEARVVVDNTFASPMLQNPLDLGADMVMHSVTKYLGGHSDVVMGCLVTSDDEWAEQIGTLQNSCGAVSGPMDCFLVLRGSRPCTFGCSGTVKTARPWPVIWPNIRPFPKCTGQALKTTPDTTLRHAKCTASAAWWRSPWPTTTSTRPRPW